MSGRIEIYDSRKEQTSKWSQNEAFSVREAGVDIGKNIEQGGSDVSVDQVVTSGREVAGITVDGERTAILIPNAGEWTQSDWAEADPSDDAYIKNKPNLASVATSGSYADLSNTPDLSNFVEDANYVHTDYNYDLGAKNIVDHVTDNLAGKVDKVSGKVLSDNNFTNAQKDKLTNLADIYGVGANLTLDPETNILSANAQPITIDDEMSSSSTNAVQNRVITGALADKVDKVSGKGLSANDFTNAYKDKLDGIDQGAEVNDISTISVNGVNIPADANKNVAIAVPSYTSGDGIDISQQNEISVDEMPNADMSDVITPLPVVVGNVSIKQENNIVWVNNKPVLALADISIYVNPQTGVDDYDGGYGFSAAKPFATIGYAMKRLPKDSVIDANGRELETITLHLAGTFTSTNIAQHHFEFPSARFYLVIDGDVTLNNVTLLFFNCGSTTLRLNGNLTINITNTSLTSVTQAIRLFASKVIVDAPNSTSQNPMSIVITGNSTVRNYIRGIDVFTSTLSCSTANLSVEVNYCDIAVNANNVSSCFLLTTSGANNSTVFNSSGGSVLSFGTNTATGTTVQRTSNGGRIYTGQQ